MIRSWDFSFTTHIKLLMCLASQTLCCCSMHILHNWLIHMKYEMYLPCIIKVARVPSWAVMIYAYVYTYTYFGHLFIINPDVLKQAWPSTWLSLYCPTVWSLYMYIDKLFKTWSKPAHVRWFGLIIPSAAVSGGSRNINSEINLMCIDTPNVGDKVVRD